jgi:hypothetical protein
MGERVVVWKNSGEPVFAAADSKIFRSKGFEIQGSDPAVAAVEKAATA